MRTTLACAAAALGAAAVLAAAPAHAVNVDPSAYAIAATGPLTLAGRPLVDWTLGPSVSATSPGLNTGPLRVGPMALAAGDTFALVHLENLAYGDTLRVASLTAACADGRTTVAVAGRAGRAALRPGARVPLPGGYALIGARSTNTDGSVTVAGLTLAVDGERLLAAVARC
jgi:hypothetical protein